MMTVSALDLETPLSALDEPAWLKEEREAARALFARLPWPTAKDESWRYAAGRLKSVPFDWPLALPRGKTLQKEELPEAVRERLKGAEYAGLLVFLGADLAYAELDGDLKEKGVLFTGLLEAARRHPERVRESLYRAVPAKDGKLPALMAAAWTHGAFLYLPKGLEEPRPFFAFFLHEEGTLSVGRTLAVLEEGARASYVEEHLGEGAHLAASELFLRPAAHLVHAHVQTQGEKSYHLYRQRALLEKDTGLRDLTVNLGADFARAEVGSELLGPGADSEMLGVYFAAGRQHHDHDTLQHHKSPQARSDVYYKGVAKDEGTIVYQGLIRLEPGAQKTDAYQTNRNLLLNRGARAESVPKLEIAANDVRCSHGSSIAPIDEEELFYLRTRGFSKESAENLLVAAFLEDVLGRIPLKDLADHLARVIEEKVFREPLLAEKGR